jgi:hypothetical protein
MSTFKRIDPEDWSKKLFWGLIAQKGALLSNLNRNTTYIFELAESDNK